MPGEHSAPELQPSPTHYFLSWAIWLRESCWTFPFLGQLLFLLNRLWFLFIFISKVKSVGFKAMQNKCVLQWTEYGSPAYREQWHREPGVSSSSRRPTNSLSWAASFSSLHKHCRLLMKLDISSVHFFLELIDPSLCINTAFCVLNIRMAYGHPTIYTRLSFFPFALYFEDLQLPDAQVPGNWIPSSRGQLPVQLPSRYLEVGGPVRQRFPSLKTAREVLCKSLVWLLQWKV